jgi:hypothetical protein
VLGAVIEFTSKLEAIVPVMWTNYKKSHSMATTFMPYLLPRYQSSPTSRRNPPRDVSVHIL